ncbi:helix-turn-helix domain-containing protein [Mammaliicoccus sciuri]|uniref:helix-turn-helix domain-containing protein n=1 Tax=Mammaliicoccus sciuri TaxID=1296 RepID=UPI003F576A34
MSNNDVEVDKLLFYIAQEVKHIRKTKKVTQDDLAFSLGVTPQYVGNIENGRESKLSLKTYLKIAAYFEIPFVNVIENAQIRMKLDENMFNND